MVGDSPKTYRANRNFISPKRIANHPCFRVVGVPLQVGLPRKGGRLLAFSHSDYRQYATDSSLSPHVGRQICHGTMGSVEVCCDRVTERKTKDKTKDKTRTSKQTIALNGPSQTKGYR